MRRFRLPVVGLAVLLTAPAVLAQPAPPPSPAETVLPLKTPTIEEAAQLQQQGKIEEAIAAWSAVVHDQPDAGVAWFNLGYCLHGAGRMDEAIEAHKKAASFEQFEGVALYNLGCAFALTGQSDDAFHALEAAQAAGFDVGEQIYEDDDLVSLRNDVRVGSFYDESGPRSGGKKQRFQQMMQQLAQKFGPQIHGAMEEFAPQALEMIRQEFPDAAPIIDQIVPAMMDKMGSMQPRSPEQVEAEEARVEENATALQQELSELVTILTETGRQILKMIEMQLNDALENNPEVRQTLGEIAADRQFDKLMEGLHQFKSKLTGGGGGGDQLGAALQQADQLAKSGDLDSAIAIYSQITQFVPDNAEAAMGLAYTLHMNGDYEKAIEAHKKAASFKQYTGVASYNLACAYALQGDADNALKAMKASHDAGFDVVAAAPSDDDFKSLREDPRFAAMLKKFKLGPEI